MLRLVHLTFHGRARFALPHAHGHAHHGAPRRTDAHRSHRRTPVAPGHGAVHLHDAPPAMAIALDRAGHRVGRSPATSAFRTRSAATTCSATGWSRRSKRRASARLVRHDARRLCADDAGRRRRPALAGMTVGDCAPRSDVALRLERRCDAGATTAGDEPRRPQPEHAERPRTNTRRTRSSCS